MKSVRKKLFISFLFMLAGCAKDSATSASLPASKPSPIPHQTQALLTYEISDGSEPATYAVTFHLNGAKSAKYDLYQVTSGSKRLELLSHLLGPKMDSSVRYPATGEKVGFELFESSSFSDEPVQTLEVVLPRDLVINGPIEAKDIGFSNLSRLYLRGAALIMTNGLDLKIQAARLIAERGAAIETFPAGHVAPENQVGRSGGNVKIEATQATGELNIVLRGESAGRLTKMPPSREKDESYRGQKGQRGTQSEVTCLQLPRFPARTCICAKSPGTGGAGGDGKQGSPGLSGLSGGASGNLDVSIKDGSEFMITDHREIGRGSDGSSGGIGGPGGFGGDPGLNSPNQMNACPNGAAGPSGKTGARGPKGEPGKPGKIGRVCLKLSDSVGTSCM